MAAVLATGTAASAHPGAIACGEATAIDQAAPLGRASPIRNLLWLAVYPFERGHPTKAIVMAQRSIERPLTLRGWDCRSGQRLRFWYGEQSTPFLHVPVTAARLRRTGSLTASFGPWGAQDMRGGYLMFWHAGVWKIVAYDGGRKVGVAFVQTAYV